MTREQKIKHIEWLALLQKIRDELAALDEAERQWLRSRLDSIGAIQLDLDTLFRAAGGVQTCAVCAGACCACGRHHLTLPNLLTYLLADEEPPAPDLDSPCPYLGEAGCRLSVDRRPYNCITFFCEQLEANLSAGSAAATGIPVPCSALSIREPARSLDCSGTHRWGRYPVDETVSPEAVSHGRISPYFMQRMNYGYQF